MPYHVPVNGNEFLGKIRRYARGRSLQVELITRKGKGSHGRLYVGDRFTTIKDRKKEFGPGLLAKMLRDLGIDPK
jgi:mRNA interferase HicA